MNVTVWSVLSIALQLIYGFCMLMLFLFGLNSLILSILYIKNRKRVWDERAIPPPDSWPMVTIQLPIYNERYTIKRLLHAVTNLDYPVDRLQIQVLDDSTDATVDVARPLVEQYQERGVNIQYIHRADRQGFKAGALTAGMRTALGDYVAVFDADFTPPRNWLKQVIPHFRDPSIGFVQTRWSHKNDRFNTLTRWISLALDAHFVVEQGSRSTAGLFMSFNGSGGIWRRATIEDSGGWCADTLTEDLDLSFRAELRGWNFVYLPNITVPGEIPVQIDAVKKQQYRWAKGTVQTFRKVAGEVLRTPMPLGKRIMGLMHLTMYMPFAFLVVTLLLVLPVGMINPHLFQYFPWTVIASFGPPLVYSLARTEHMPELKDRVALLPGLLLFGVGISLNCGLGAVAGLFTKGGVFERTPKFDLRNGQQKVVKSSYLLPRNPIVWGELGMGAYNLITVYMFRGTPGETLIPWLLSCAAGFFLIAGLSFIHHWRRTQRASKESKERTPAVYS